MIIFIIYNIFKKIIIGKPKRFKINNRLWSRLSESRDHRFKIFKINLYAFGHGQCEICDYKFPYSHGQSMA